MYDRKLKYKDMIGTKINYLTILEVVTKEDKRRRFFFKCLCDCGNETIARVDCIFNGNTKSCGCLWKKNCTNRSHGASHGNTFMPEYKVWTSMKMRCRNPNFVGYKNYGGRGIKLCKRWDSFKNFIKDMGRRPSDAHSIDRINNDGNYSRLNCRWATKQEQNANQRRRKKACYYI